RPALGKGDRAGAAHLGQGTDLWPHGPKERQAAQLGSYNLHRHLGLRRGLADLPRCGIRASLAGQPAGRNADDDAGAAPLLTGEVRQEVTMNSLEQSDPEIWQAIQGERRRQQQGLEMIASENYTSAAVMVAQGSVLTNKYAEGYPGKRYYGGCEYVDVAERLAIERVLKLFGAERANVQPHSGAQANMAVFMAALQPGDTILGLDLAHGGHLKPGMKLNFSGKYFRVIAYGVRRDTERIDYDQLASLAREHLPKMIIAGASAYPREIDFAKFAEICREAGALLMVDMAHIAGMVAADQHMNPVPFADFVTTTTHKTLRGPRGGAVLCKQDWIQKINSSVFPRIQG